MCLAIPMKIITTDGVTAQGEAAGLTRSIRVDLLDDVKSGDYVILHAGFAIQKLSEEEALENIRLLREIQNSCMSGDSYPP